MYPHLGYHVWIQMGKATSLPHTAFPTASDPTEFGIGKGPPQTHWFPTLITSDRHHWLPVLAITTVSRQSCILEAQVLAL